MLRHWFGKMQGYGKCCIRAISGERVSGCCKAEQSLLCLSSVSWNKSREVLLKSLMYNPKRDCYARALELCEVCSPPSPPAAAAGCVWHRCCSGAVRSDGIAAEISGGSHKSPVVKASNAQWVTLAQMWLWARMQNLQINRWGTSFSLRVQAHRGTGATSLGSSAKLLPDFTASFLVPSWYLAYIQFLCNNRQFLHLLPFWCLTAINHWLQSLSISESTDI